MLQTLTHTRLPPHLAEVSALLAAGFVRLSRRTAEDYSRDVAHAREQRENDFDLTAHQSGHANPRDRECT
jgi:hypothetical protein